MRASPPISPEREDPRTPDAANVVRTLSLQSRRDPWLAALRGDNVVESAITRHSAEELGLKKGDKVTAVIKATEVMIEKG